MARLTGVAYARYSSDKQQESSIVVQLAAIAAFFHDEVAKPRLSFKT